MTTRMRVAKKCVVCGKESMYSVMTSTSCFGSADLDTRPPQMERSSMMFWVDECPECGYVASDIEDPASVNMELLKSEKYKTTDGIDFTSGLARTFYKQYLLAKDAGDVEEAFCSALYAAWACDDSRDEENAIICRKQALAEGEKLLEEDPGEIELMVQLADIMRKARMFDEVIDKYSGVQLGVGLLDTIIAFQIELAKEQNVETYTVEEMLNLKREDAE